MIPLFTFFFSLVILVIFLGMRLKSIRSGKRSVIVEGEDKHTVRFHIDTLERAMIKYTKEYGHKTIVFSLKTYVIASHLFGKKYKQVRMWILDKLSKKTEGDVKESFFLKAVGDYKKRVKHFKAKLEEHDKNKEE